MFKDKIVILACDSPVFTRPRRDESNHTILNLKALNRNTVYYHFKIDTHIEAGDAKLLYGIYRS